MKITKLEPYHKIIYIEAIWAKFNFTALDTWLTRICSEMNKERTVLETIVLFASPSTWKTLTFWQISVSPWNNDIKHSKGCNSKSETTFNKIWGLKSNITAYILKFDRCNNMHIWWKMSIPCTGYVWHCICQLLRPILKGKLQHLHTCRQ